jgi:hypothetical protein
MELIEAPDLESLGIVLEARDWARMSKEARPPTSGGLPNAAPSSTRSGAI